MLGLALGQADFGFDAAAFVVQVQRHQGEAFLFHLADQPLDLFSVHQEFAGAVGFRVDVGGGAAQRVDAATDQEKLATLDHHITVSQLHLPGAHGLDLPADQHHAGFVTFTDVVVEPGAAVFGDGFGGFFFGHGGVG